MKRDRNPLGKHARIAFWGAEKPLDDGARRTRISMTKQRPWTIKARNRRRNKAARASRKKNRP